MNLSKRWFTAVGLAIGAVGTNTQAQTDLTAYDGFTSAPRANLAGAGGGLGWTGVWEPVTGGIVTSVTTDGLVFPHLPTAGGSAKAPSSIPDFTGYVRYYPPVAGDTLYVSYLIRPEPDMMNWFAFRFGYYPYQVDVGLPIGSFHYGMMIGRSTGVSTGIPAEVGKTRFLVLEVKHDPAAMNTKYSMYVDPTPGGSQPSIPSATYTRAGLHDFGMAAEFRGYAGYSFDELRIGTTWASVTPSDAGCPADFNGDGFVTGDDFDAYVAAFTAGDPSADFNGDGFVTGDDFDAFVVAFTAGC